MYARMQMDTNIFKVTIHNSFACEGLAFGRQIRLPDLYVQSPPRVILITHLILQSSNQNEG